MKLSEHVGQIKSEYLSILTVILYVNNLNDDHINKITHTI